MTDKKTERFDKIANKTYYLNADMVRFLLVENLALKMLLHEKGLINPEEYRESQAAAAKVLDAKADEQITKWKVEHKELIDMFDTAIESQGN